MSIDLGRVMPIPKGEYVATTAYKRLDIVTSGGQSYICLVDNAGQPVTDTNYWMVLAIKGSQGLKGDTGAPGADGNDGAAATIAVGTVTTGAAGTNASVTNAGTTNAAKFNFTIPQGAKGDTGSVDNAGLTAAPAFVALQTQVDNSAVGTNLLLDSKTQTNATSWYTPNYDWNENTGTYLGSNIKRTNYVFDNARYSYKDLLDRGVINTADDFTYSVYFRVVGEDPAGMSYANILFYSSATTKHNTVPLQLTNLKEDKWARIVVPLKFIDVAHDPDQQADWNHSIRVEISSAPKVSGAYYEFAAPKLEKGSVATDWTPAPEDQNHIADRRTINSTPSWYIQNYPQQSITEFKDWSVMGVKAADFPTGTSPNTTYCTVRTDVPWTDNSAGWPYQTIEISGEALPVIFVRVGISDSDWSAVKPITFW